MTDREKAIVMAHTGICMLTGDKFQIFHKYVEDIMGRPIWTHEMGIGSIADEIKKKSKGDFIALCADESRSENPNKWISVSERLPDNTDPVNITWVNHDPESYYADIKDKPFTATGHYCNGRWWWYSVTCQDYLDEYGRCDVDAMDDAIEVIAWMPLPSPFEPQESEK